LRGGYSNNPNDRGGETNFGITAGTYAKTILYLAEAVREHVQSCFDREKELSERLDREETLAGIRAVCWEDLRLKEARA